MSLLVKQNNLDNFISNIRDKIIFNDKISNKVKYKLIDIINKTEFVVDESLATNNKKYMIKINEINEHVILHEIYHLLLSHTTKINRNKIHNPCIIENLLFDIQVEKLLYEHYGLDTNITGLENKLFSLYSDDIDLTIDNVLSIDCSKCDNNYIENNINNNKSYTKDNNEIKIKIKNKLFEILQSITRHKYVAIQHRNYINSKYFVPTKRELKNNIYIIIDTSTSIPEDIVRTIINVCNDFQTKLTYIQLYGFSDKLYKLENHINYTNKTNFLCVYEKFKNEKNVIIISDLQFTKQELYLLENSNIKVIDICSL